MHYYKKYKVIFSLGKEELVNQHTTYSDSAQYSRQYEFDPEHGLSLIGETFPFNLDNVSPLSGNAYRVNPRELRRVEILGTKKHPIGGFLSIHVNIYDTPIIKEKGEFVSVVSSEVELVKDREYKDEDDGKYYYYEKINPYYLIEQNGGIYSWSLENDWLQVDENLTEDLFTNNGINNLSIIPQKSWNALRSKGDSFKILSWVSEGDDSLRHNIEVLYLLNTTVSRNINLTALPHPQLLIPKEDIEVGEIESVYLNATAPESGDLKILVSENSGESWHGKNNIQVSIADLSLVKEFGYTPDELNNLMDVELTTRFPNGKARFAFYLEQESLDDIVEIHSLSINETIYTMTPSVSDLSVIYELLEADKPTLYASRDDGENWIQINEDELKDISSLPEGNQLRVKVVLESGQELYGLSYSWI